MLLCFFGSMWIFFQLNFNFNKDPEGHFVSFTMPCLVLVQIRCTINALSDCNSESIMQQLAFTHQKSLHRGSFPLSDCVLHIVSLGCLSTTPRKESGLLTAGHGCDGLQCPYSFFSFLIPWAYSSFCPVHVCEKAMLCCSVSVFAEQAEIRKIILVWGKKVGSKFSSCNLEHTKHSE